MKPFEVVAIVLALLGAGLGVIGLTYKPPAQKNRIVCFDTSRNIRLNMIEYNIRFDGRVVRATNGDGEYAIYPLDGWLCSIIKADK